MGLLPVHRTAQRAGGLLLVLAGATQKTLTPTQHPSSPHPLHCRFHMMYGASPFQEALDKGASLPLAVLK